MSTLTEFILQRIAEDEATAEHAREGLAAMNAHALQVMGREAYDPARVLAECEAKRGAIEAAWGDHLQIEGEWGSCRGRRALEEANDYPAVVLWLALPYADHPDFDPDWTLT